VSVSEIARAAEVSEATVYNYFPTKEDLVYYGMEAFEEALLAAVRDRPAGQSVLEAFGRFATAPRGLLAAQDDASAAALLQVSRMVGSSPSLLARERQILAGYTDSLAVLLAEETGAGPNDLRPRVVAAALIGLHASLIEYVRRRLQEDQPDARRMARGVRTEGERAIALLEGGLAGYAIKRGPAEPGPIKQAQVKQAQVKQAQVKQAQVKQAQASARFVSGPGGVGGAGR
jgi:AcrR family transcriptional regulator